jgi:hypothetical protein
MCKYVRKGFSYKMTRIANHISLAHVIIGCRQKCNFELEHTLAYICLFRRTMFLFYLRNVHSAVGSFTGVEPISA